MAQGSDITSTEKLLNVIRDKTPAPAPAAAPAPEAPKPKPAPAKLLLKVKASGRKSSTVGIDIGHEYLRLVKAAESGGKWRIVARRRLRLPAGAARDIPEFSNFLRTSLSSFCGSPDQSDLWAITSAAGVELRHIRIPKVPKKQIANAVYWMIKKEIPFNEKETILDFEVQGEVIEQGVPKLAVMAYTAPQHDIDELKNFFARIGWPLKGVSIVPFATQNLFRRGWIPTLEGTVASLYIGNDFSRIDIYSGGNLVMTRGIKAGATSMVEAVVDQIGDLQQDPQAPIPSTEQGRRVLNSLSPDALPLEPSDYGFGLSKEAVFEMAKPSLDRLVRQVERTFEHYMTGEGTKAIVKVFVSSAMNIYQPVVAFVGSQLGVESAVLDPLSAQGPPVPCPDVNDTQNISERLAFAPALGLALSDSEITQNLIFTSKDKEKVTYIARVNKSIFAVFFIFAFACMAVLAYQGIGIMQKKDGIARLEAQLAALGPTIERDQLVKLTAKLDERRKLSKVYAERYTGMVLISELATLTPANIRFTSLKTNLGSGAPKAAAPAKAGATPAAAPAAADEVTIEGLVMGDRKTMESALAAYVLLLEASPVFRNIAVQKNAVEPFMKGQALHFIINMKVEEQIRG